MKKSVVAKTGAIILFTIFSILSFLLGFAVLYMLDMGMYAPTCNISDFIQVRYSYYEYFQTLFQMRYYLIVFTIVSVLFSVILFVFLMCSAGHSKKYSDVMPNFMDKIPFDIYLILFSIVMFLLSALLVELLYGNLSTEINCAFCLIYALITIPLIISCIMTFATRIKLGTVIKNTLVFKISHLIYIGAKTLILATPFIWKSLLTIFLVCFFEFILTTLMISSYDGGFWCILWFMFNFSVLSYIIYYVIQLSRLKKGAEKLSTASLDAKIDTKNMYGSIKNHAEIINTIGNGLNKAVEQRLKSERFKTELITNVSHDIKTPLTSIINYIDLIRKEKIDNEKVILYLEVLDRQSKRLKKLTEDIVEASKASTGNITVNLSPVNVSELLSQSIAEYSERFSILGLTPIINISEMNSAIFADGKLTWRIFDNLLNNICKYSMPNSRIYINIIEEEKFISISFKNISKEPLNVSPDELMERFVRGDSARSTEGSGLGLSIAKSLTELQNATFTLYIDGDLFSATVKFNKV